MYNSPGISIALIFITECGSFDKFLPLYLFLRCLDFSKLHGHAEEKCYFHSDQDITLLVQITIKERLLLLLLKNNDNYRY
ncbi:hypothetical protein AHAS_Ahas01G0123400 [Arachis hypogaea]